MATIPVDKMMSILNIFRTQSGKTGMSKNQVYRATGIKNKGPILTALNLLVKDKVLDSKKANKQKEILNLTPLGQEIVDLVNDIIATNGAHDALDKKLLEYELLMRKACYAYDRGEKYYKTLRSMLLRKGWNDKEAQMFDEIIESTWRVEKIYRKNICNSLMQRYSLIMSNFEITDNVREILTKIILTEITHVLSLRTHFYDRSPIPVRKESKQFDDFGLLVHQEIRTLYEQDDMILKRFTSNEVRNLVTSILSIARLNQNLVKDFIKLFDDDLNLAMERIGESKEKKDALHITKMEQKIEALSQIRQIYRDINALYKT